MLIALTRPVSAALARCELTHLARTPIDVARAAVQHAAYEIALRAAGAIVHRLPAADDLPDAVFVEDVAVVLDEVAVITRPGAASRRPETAAVEAALAGFRPLAHVAAPGTVDGGDVLVAGRTLFVGRSSRTNEDGVRQLASAVNPYGYRVVAVEVGGCLHLKSAATLVGDGLLLVNPAWVPAGAFPGFDRLAVDPAEPYAANALRVRDRLLFPEHFPRTRNRLEGRGLSVVPVPCDELAKAEGAVTCCSIVFRAAAGA
jgi:dimethylargininase